MILNILVFECLVTKLNNAIQSPITINKNA